MKKEFQLLDSEVLHRGFLQLHRHRLRHQSYLGGWCPEVVRERLEGLNAVSVLLYDPDLDQVVMVEQFRVGLLEDPAGPWVLETVGGYWGPEESAEEVACREALEEADCELLELLPICEFYTSPGLSSERISLFCARVDSAGAGGVHGLAHEGEEIRVVVLSAEQAIAALYGRINSTSSLIAVQWFAAHREELRRRWGNGR